MNRITRIIAVAVLLCLAILGTVAPLSPANASKDITWGRHAVHAKDITWGKHKAPQTKDITWGRAVPMHTLMRKGILNDVTHASDDSGWAGPIHIVCGGEHVYLARGEKSALGVNSKCGVNVDRWIVPAGHTYYCKNALPPYQNRYIYVGSTDVPSYSSWKCYDQKAL